MKKLNPKKSQLLSSYKKETVCTGGKFGHNCEFDFLPIFKRIEKFGALILVIDYHSIGITLPDKNASKLLDIVIYIFTKLPGASLSTFNKDLNALYLEWHY